MAAGSIDRTLGELVGKMEVLIKQVDAIRADISESEDKADVSRANMHRRLDEVVARTSSLESDMPTVKKSIGEVRQVTDEVERWKIAGMGALGVTGIAAGAIASLVTAYWDAIVRVFRS